MKIRNGFVSNSSSSSFVIALTGEIKKCPCCGHEPDSIITLLQGGRHDYYGDESHIEDLNDYMGELEYEHNNCVTHIAELEQRDPNEPTYPRYCDSSKVKDTLKWRREELQELEDRIAKFKQLEQEGKKVYRLRLEYHDGLAERVFNENVKAGIITVIEGEG